jgi:plasmid segregation protein ParM
MKDIIVGLDLGHSAVKMTFDGKSGTVDRFIFPSLAAPAIQIRNEAEAKIAADETIAINGRNFFVGNTAAIQGRAGLSNGLTSEWISSDEHSALIAMAKRVVDKSGVDGLRLYVLGLPVVHFETHKDILKEKATQQLGNNCEIRVIPQPIGGYQAHMLNRNGAINKERSFSDESWGVIDVGYYSTDFILMMQGRWVESSSGGCGGVRMAAEHMQRLLEAKGIQRDLVDVEKGLREGFIRHFGDKMDLSKEISEATELVASKVIDMATQLMSSHVHSLDGVLVTGGGADIIFSTMKSRWPHVKLIEDSHNNPKIQGSRFIVSEGYYRWGRNVNLLRQLKSRK